MEFIYSFKPSETHDGEVNFDKLEIELKASSISIDTVKGVSGEIQIKTTAALTPEEISSETIPLGIIQIVGNHVGAEEADISPLARDKRLTKLLELGQMALYHPAPKITEVSVMSYLTSIDNYFNSWIRLGKHSLILGKITTDAANTAHPQYELLNEIVNMEGNTVAQFLMGGIIEASS